MIAIWPHLPLGKPPCTSSRLAGRVSPSGCKRRLYVLGLGRSRSLALGLPFAITPRAGDSRFLTTKAAFAFLWFPRR